MAQVLHAHDHMLLFPATTRQRVANVPYADRQSVEYWPRVLAGNKNMDEQGTYGHVIAKFRSSDLVINLLVYTPAAAISAVFVFCIMPKFAGLHCMHPAGRVLLSYMDSCINLLNIFLLLVFLIYSVLTSHACCLPSFHTDKLRPQHLACPTPITRHQHPNCGNVTIQGQKETAETSQYPCADTCTDEL